jgi:hypothetical protein
LCNGLRRHCAGPKQRRKNFQRSSMHGMIRATRAAGI